MYKGFEIEKIEDMYMIDMGCDVMYFSTEQEAKDYIDKLEGTIYKVISC